jgi:hypothetical protein
VGETKKSFIKEKKGEKIEGKKKKCLIFFPSLSFSLAFLTRPVSRTTEKIFEKYTAILYSRTSPPPPEKPLRHANTHELKVVAARFT